MIDLEELYALDPGLREHEAELLKLLARLEKAKPVVKADQAFVASLRRELLNKEVPAHHPFINYLLMPKPYLIGGGVLAVLLVALVAVTQMQGPGAPLAPAPGGALDGRVIALGPGAFGSLSAASLSADRAEAGALPPMAGGDLSVPSGSARPQSGGGGLMASENAKIGLIYPEPFQSYTLVYDGEAYELPAGEMDVYRRLKNVSGMAALGRAVAGAPNGVLNLSRLGALNLANFTVTTGGRDGYSVNIDLREARAYIGPNYEDGYIEDAYDRTYSLSDVPSDDRLVASARAFLSRFGVDVSAYGTPVVDRNWERFYIMERGRGNDAYVPPVINVTFPYLVGGETVTDQGGLPYGIGVGVRISDLRAVSAHNIAPQSFERSAYAVETDWNRVKRIAERGGLYGFWYGSPEGGTIRLGAPELVYMFMHHYDEAARQGMELYVPALRFELIDPPGDAVYGPRYVFVPLVKDILDAYDRGPDEMPPGIPRPLPVDLPVTMELKDESAE